MNISNFAEVRHEIVNNFKREMLIPILGSGFSRACISRAGRVPSGMDYKDHMVREIGKHESFNESKLQLQVGHSW